MTQYRGKFATDIGSWLSYLYQPILPFLRKLEIRREGSREPEPRDILLPDGFAAQVVTTGLNAPVHCTFDDQGFCFVAESGHKIDSPPRIVRVDARTGEKKVHFEFPPERWVKSGSLTGVCWHDGFLYVTNTDTLSRIGPDGELEDLVTGLPGLGDHQTNHPVVGPDQKVYFGQGCVTNMGVVGADNFAFEWLDKHPQVHDVPAKDVVLAGRNYVFQNVLGDVTAKVTTGAFVPFGTETRPGQVIPGDVKCSGSILRCNLDGSDLEVVAWGLRNPFSVAFHPDGRLFATEHGADERGARQILDDPDDFYAIEQGRWYGWPDFASGIRLDDPHWGKAGQGREPVLAEFPEQNPPRPLVSFWTHTAANGMDIARDARFGFAGQAFVACFGDLAPITTLRRALTPAGFKVVRVNPMTSTVHDFAVNRIAGPASMLPHRGFERPSHCQFGLDGALYVVDWGVIKIAPEAGAIRMPLGTGALWRIYRTGELYGQVPPEPIRGPVYGLRYLLMLAGAVLAAVGIGWLLIKLFRRR